MPASVTSALTMLQLPLLGYEGGRLIPTHLHVPAFLLQLGRGHKAGGKEERMLPCKFRIVKKKKVVVRSNALKYF